MQANNPTEIETRRLAAVQSAGLIDKDVSHWFRGHVAIAKSIGRCMLASVSLVDADRSVFLSHNFPVGLDATEVPRRHAFGDVVIASGKMEVVEDLRKDQRFASNPYVSGPPGFVFWAGWPLFSAQGDTIGTLEIADLRPHSIDSHQRESLAEVARQITRQISVYMETEQKAHAHIARLFHRFETLGTPPSLSLAGAFIRFCGNHALTPDEAEGLMACELVEMTQRDQPVLSSLGEDLRHETGLSSSLSPRRAPRLLSREQMERYFKDLAENTVSR